MLQRILQFLTDSQASPDDRRVQELEDAVAALMIEAARMDDAFDAAERSTIERLLRERFHLGADEVRRLVAEAERAVARSAQLFPFTQKVLDSLSVEARAGVLEMLWKVAYADGVLDPHEDMLLRRVAGLVHVPDRERGLARQSALRKLAERRQATKQGPP
jgi:uncharacterized tellurite resistance protein B-like protein